MHAQLQEIIDELRSAQQRMDALGRNVPDATWMQRPAPERWSIAENVEHLNLFSERMIPMIDAALQEARSLVGGRGAANVGAGHKYRRGFFGGMLHAMMGPPVRFGKTKAVASFVPVATIGPAGIRERFTTMQHRLISLATAADGLPIDRVSLTSPVNEKLKYNLFAALGIIARHQHRHLWQAEQTLPS